MQETITNQTEKSRKTRMKIGDTIIALMEKQELGAITVSKICELAGVSRMTFYHYYETKEAALMDYLSELISLFVEEAKALKINVKLGSIEHICFSFDFFSRYEKFLLQLEKSGCYDILINGVNRFLEINYKDTFKDAIYNLYFYAGALLNVFMKWLKSGRKESVDSVAKLVNKGFLAELT